jgi:hypothetical protein
MVIENSLVGNQVSLVGESRVVNIGDASVFDIL